MKSSPFLLTMVLPLAVVVTSVGAQTVFFDDFEQPISINWTGWADLSETPACCGPEMLFNDGAHAHDGTKAARQESAQPWWYASKHDEPGLTNDADHVIQLSAWQFEDFNWQGPVTDPGNAQYHNRDQVQGWLTLMSADESEFFAIGVHAHWNSPPPVLDWWQYLAWGTAADGWHVTAVPRAQGWRHLLIEVHPYTGSAGDARFYVDGQLVGEGSRMPGGGSGVAVTRIGIGANPYHNAEDTLANTYEFFWYDEVTLGLAAAPWPCLNPDVRFDADADGDVDHEDFGVHQACITGENDPGGAYDFQACRCMNSDGDTDVDGVDTLAFEACASAPAVAANPACDDGLASP